MEIVQREEPPLEWKLSQPIVWATLSCGVRIQELLPDKFDEVAELLRSQLIPRETMCKALKMSETDPESCDTLVQEAIGCMRDGFSIVGVVEEEVEEQIEEAGKEVKGDEEEDDREEKIKSVDEKNKITKDKTQDGDGSGREEKYENSSVRKKERVVAAMIARVVHKREAMETFSRVKVYKGEAYRKYAKLNNHVMKKAALYSAYNTESYYRIYHIVVHEDYKNRGIALFMGKLAVHRLTLKQSICVKLCSDRPTQHLMRRLGFTDYLRLGYEEWLEKGHQVFFDTGVGNYSIVLMVHEAAQLGDVYQTLEEKEVEPPPGPPIVFPGRAKTGQPSFGNRGHLIKPTPPVVTGRLADYRYLFQKAFDPAPFVKSKH